MSPDSFALPLLAQSRSFLRMLIEGAELPGAVIFVLSILALGIIVEQFRSMRRARMLPAAEIDAARALLESRRFKDCIFQLQHSRTMFAQVLLAGLRQARNGYESMSEMARETGDLWTSRLLRRTEYLHVLGHLGPLVGLLGTVLGMIRAFAKMQETRGSYRPEDLAGGISLALVNTFLGLSLAVLALGMFGVCRNRVEAMCDEVSTTVHELLEHVRPAAGGEIPAAPRPPRVEPAAVPRSGIISAPKPAAL